MIKNITLGQYIPGDSSVHRLDPRTKITICFLFMVSIFLINNFIGYALTLLFLWGIISISKLKFKYVYRGLKPIFVLLMLTAVINMLMIRGTGEPLISIWIIKVYKEGIIRALFMVTRLILLILGTSILTLTTSPIELTDGIEKLLSPFKKVGVPAHELAMMMTIALRFIPTLMDETDKIMKAQMARGVELDTGSLINKAKNLIPILVPLFISSFRRADELAVAMEARAYRGGEGRTRMKILKRTKADYVATGIFLLFAAVAIGTRFVI